MPPHSIRPPSTLWAGHRRGREVIVAADSFAVSRVGQPAGDYPALYAGSVLVAVAVDARLAAHLMMSDLLRDGAGSMPDGLRQRGMARILLATGARAVVAAHAEHTHRCWLVRSWISWRKPRDQTASSMKPVGPFCDVDC